MTLTHYFRIGYPYRAWYQDTFRALSVHFGADTPLFVSILAATSINATVKSNARLAVKAWRQYQAHGPFDGYLPVVAHQLDRLRSGLPLSGPKIARFARALSGDTECVIVDRWMLRALGIHKHGGANVGERARVNRAIRTLARRHHLTPRDTQAAVWFGVKLTTETARGVTNPAPPFERLITAQLAEEGAR